MPLFYFDSRDGDTFIRDDEGLVFPSIETARDQAALALAELARDVLPAAGPVQWRGPGRHCPGRRHFS